MIILSNLADPIIMVLSCIQLIHVVLFFPCSHARSYWTYSGFMSDSIFLSSTFLPFSPPPGSKERNSIAQVKLDCHSFPAWRFVEVLLGFSLQMLWLALAKIGEYKCCFMLLYFVRQMILWYCKEIIVQTILSIKLNFISRCLISVCLVIYLHLLPKMLHRT